MIYLLSMARSFADNGISTRYQGGCMSFPQQDVYWLNTLAFIASHRHPEDILLVPAEFTEKLTHAFDYSYSYHIQEKGFQWLVIHKGRIPEINNFFLRKFIGQSAPVFANEVFVVFSKNSLPKVKVDSVHLRALYKKLEEFKKASSFYWFSKAVKNLMQIFRLSRSTVRTHVNSRPDPCDSLEKTASLIETSKIESVECLHHHADYYDKLLANIKRTNDQRQPNLNFLNERLLFTADAVRLNIKSLGYEYARSLRDKLILPENLSPQKIGLNSKACQQRDIECNWFLYWCQQLHTPVVYHRKLWEFCYILQALYEHDCLTPGRKGLGFGCGEEPLPSLLAAYDIAITATDLDPRESAAQGWIATNQNMASLEKIWHPGLCTRELFDKNVSLQYIDMNAIPDHLEGKYDFCWSACALEHLGSIKNGLQFIKNSLKTLIPGGLSIHTTEFNYLEDEETIDNYGTVLFRKRDFEELSASLAAANHEVAVLDFSVGADFLDRFIDLPPYNSKIYAHTQDAHLKLLIDGFASTSFGLIIRKSK
ncbi:MAG TPA: hypothetical protein VE971_04045 [Candidatus Eisenbacteria bacterium]|nr:hypothetical protein [Candidatus Eisenbacteria bacterium]